MEAAQARTARCQRKLIRCVPTAGKTPAEVEKGVVDRIKNRAIEPQVVVALVTQNTSLITVVGEVNNLITSVTGRIPAQPPESGCLTLLHEPAVFGIKGKIPGSLSSAAAEGQLCLLARCSMKRGTTSGRGPAIPSISIKSLRPSWRSALPDIAQELHRPLGV
jgi:hypothetical protein